MAGPRNPKWFGFFVPHENIVSDVGGPSRTRQEFAEECDINTIMQKYERTGVVNHFSNGQPTYLDLADYPDDLQGTLERLQEATGAFMRLPAHVRREFDNDPVRFVGFAEDGSNLEKMREWGLAPPAVLPDAPREEPVPPPAAD